MTTISAKSILASQSETGARIDTLLLRYPRWIHAELMTHRAFSRNAASSRAIPIQKQIDAVLADPAVPIFWTKNEPGMQGADGHGELIKIPYTDGNDDDAHYYIGNDHAWLEAMEDAIKWAQRFADAGYHKQVVTRLLEPFSHITVLVTSTEWSNFFALRDHPAAEPHMQMLAREMRKAIDGAVPQQIRVRDWHLPFVDKERLDHYEKEVICLSVARCASTSYKTVDDFDMTQERASVIVDKLMSSEPMHASPFEHQAMADNGDYRGWANPDEHCNFVGFRQLRAMIEHGTYKELFS